MKKMWLVVFALMGFVSVGRAQSLGVQTTLGESGSVWLSGGLYLMRVESDATLNGMPVSLEIEDNEGRGSDE